MWSCCYCNNKANWFAAILRCLCVRMWCELSFESYGLKRFPLEAHILVSLASLASLVLIIYSQVCSCLIIIHCSLRTNDLTDTGAITLARALLHNKSLEKLKWVVWCSEENCQCCRARLPHFSVLGQITVTYWLSCYVSHSLLALILEYTYSLSQSWRK